MSDTTTGDSARTTRAPVADRQWIDALGAEVSAEEATGFRYIYLADKGKNFLWQTGLPAGSAATMLAIFGGLTKAGNICSTLLNGPKGDPNADVIQGISDWFEELDAGVWSADRVGGIRVNADVLARAIAHAKGETHDNAHQPYLDKIQNRLRVQDPGKKAGTEISYASFAMRNPKVAEAYQRLLPVSDSAPDVSAL
jgi:hypothetical protein